MIFPSNIRVAAREFTSVFSIIRTKNNTLISGVEGEFLKVLSEQLHFTYEVFSPYDRQWGTTDWTGNWTGVIGMILRNEVDMGLSHISITEERANVVDFSFPYTVLDRTFVTAKPGDGPKMASFTYPFNTSVWILILVLTVIAPLLFRPLMFKKRSFASVFFMIFGSMLKQPIDNSEQPSMQRLIYSSWVGSMTLLYFAYSGILLSYITVPWQKKGIRNIKDLVDALQAGTHKCLAPDGTIDTQLLLNSNLHYYRIIGEYIARNNWVYESSAMSEKLLDGRTVLIGSRSLLHGFFGYDPYVTEYISDDSFGVWNIGIALKKNFCCKEELNFAILRTLSSGLYEKWWKDSAFKSSWSQISKTQDTKQSIRLPLEDLYGVFILLFAGYILSFVAFFVEISMKRFKKEEVVQDCLLDSKDNMQETVNTDNIL
ncbi:glutamate receptor ionotropic, delta-2 [Trichonephila clavata]|uniref:Glutamate receptor ionotropic, delta-2 n=1 Tax=Trichonephila clavata TaxID=2740835 RepID=A0A8X6I3B7_TRICU|nr:glutamate receptor ionotropic, delta-2 [Trichonephila clavata]